jgi:hypothetical protein
LARATTLGCRIPRGGEKSLLADGSAGIPTGKMGRHRRNGDDVHNPSSPSRGRHRCGRRRSRRCYCAQCIVGLVVAVSRAASRSRSMKQLARRMGPRGRILPRWTSAPA